MTHSDTYWGTGPIDLPPDVDEEPWGLAPKTYSTTPADVFIAAAVAVFALGVAVIIVVRRVVR